MGKFAWALFSPYFLSGVSWQLITNPAFTPIISLHQLIHNPAQTPFEGVACTLTPTCTLARSVNIYFYSLQCHLCFSIKTMLFLLEIVPLSCLIDSKNAKMDGDFFQHQQYTLFYKKIISFFTPSKYQLCSI